MHRFAVALLFLRASFSSASDAVDLQATVITPDGKPAAGVDVWLVAHKQGRPPYTVADHVTTDAAGHFVFGKDVIGKLWKDSIYPQIVARDRDGRLGSLYLIYPGVRAIGDTIKLRDVGEVRGQILEAEGRPIAGAKITPHEFGRVIVERQFVEPTYLPPELANGHRTESAADGGFIIRGVPGGARLNADIEADGFARVTIDWDTTTPLALRLPRPATVAGTLKGATETEHAGKSLTLVTADLPQQVGPRGPLILSFDQDQKTGRDGAFRFEGVPPGRYTLKASENKIGASYLEESEIKVEPGRDPSALVLVLRPSRLLRGRVVDVNGAGVAGVPVSLCRFRNLGRPFGRQLLSADSASVSGSDGGYEGYVIADGEIGARIESLPEGYARKDAGEVVALKDPQALLPPLVVQKIEPLIVRVVDLHGKPVVDAKMEVIGAALFLPNGPPKPSGADGIVKLPLADRSENATLRVIAGDVVSEPLTIDPDDERGPVTMIVSPANAFRLSGQVVDRGGKSVIGAQVQVMSMVAYRSAREQARQAAVAAAAERAAVKVADAERAKARKQADIAQAVQKFLEEDLIDQANVLRPDVKGSKPDPEIKLKTAIDRAAGKIRERFAGQPLTEASVRAAIGRAYVSLGLYGDARPHLELARSLCRTELARTNLPEPDAVAASAILKDVSAYLASVEMAQGRYDIAAQLLRESKLPGVEQVFAPIMDLMAGKDVAPEVLKGLELMVQTTNKLAELFHFIPEVGEFTERRQVNGLINYSRYSEAEVLLRRMIDRRRQAEKPSRDLFVFMTQLADVYFKQGKTAEAEATYVAARDGFKQLMGEANPFTAMCDMSLGEILSTKGEYDRAEKLFRTALTTFQGQLSGSLPQFWAQSALGTALIRQKKYTEAEPLLRSAFEGVKSHAWAKLSVGTDLLVDISGGLVQIYEANGKPDEAAKWRKELEAAKAAVRPPPKP